jgi:hypothetical protein
MSAFLPPSPWHDDTGRRQLQPVLAVRTGPAPQIKKTLQITKEITP